MSYDISVPGSCMKNYSILLKLGNIAIEEEAGDKEKIL
jgi:hypothetical protein